MDPIDRETMLEVDTNLPPGQKFAVLSIVTPPEMQVQRKERRMCEEFIRELCARIPALEEKKAIIMDEYTVFRERNYDRILALLDEENVKNTMYAFKVRGVYPSEEIAKRAALSIHSRDPYYDASIAPVGMWLPVDVGVDSVNGEHTIKELQDLLDSYHDGQEEARAEFQKRVKSISGSGEVVYVDDDGPQPDVKVTL